MIQFAVLNRFNNIVIQVRGRGDAFYNSKFVPKSSLIKDLDFDPLAYVLPVAKEKGLKVHVWLNAYLLWSSSIKPIQNEHLANTKIEWIDHNQLQKKSLKELLIDNKNRKNGFEGIYLSPGHPNVNKYLFKVFKELVDEYDIDGIHLDYIRLHDQGYGKNPYAIANFRKYNNSNNQIDALSLDQYFSQEWNDFLRKSITELVSDTKDMICLLYTSTLPTN